MVGVLTRKLGHDIASLMTLEQGSCQGPKAPANIFQDIVITN